MSETDRKPESALSTAAGALQAELEGFEGLAEQLRRAPLDTQKHLEKAAKALGEVARADERLNARVQALVEAVNTARERQQQHAEAIRARARDIEQRAGVFQRLMERYAALGQDAAALNAMGQEIATEHRGVQTVEQRAVVVGKVQALRDRMGEVAATAEALATTATEEQFTDVAHQADALRQQLLAVKNKLGLMNAPSA